MKSEKVAPFLTTTLRRRSLKESKRTQRVKGGGKEGERSRKWRAEIIKAMVLETMISRQKASSEESEEREMMRNDAGVARDSLSSVLIKRVVR